MDEEAILGGLRSGDDLLGLNRVWRYIRQAAVACNAPDKDIARGRGRLWMTVIS